MNGIRSRQGGLFMAQIVAGTMLAFSGDQYSDKWTTGPFEVLKGFDQADVVAQYLESIAGLKDKLMRTRKPTSMGLFLGSRAMATLSMSTRRSAGISATWISNL